MNGKSIACVLFALALLPALASSIEPVASTFQEAVGKDKPKLPEKDKKLTEPPKTDIFNLPSLMGNQFATGFNPLMLGDFPGSFAQRSVTVIGMQVTTITALDLATNTRTTTTTTTPVTLTKNVAIPGGSMVAFKVSENVSARPQDRFFCTYNFYADLRGPQKGPNDPLAQQQTTVSTMGNVITTTTTTTIVPKAPIPNISQHRELVGIEKSFFAGRGSVELRLPISQQVADIDGFSSRNVGDLTVIGKYAIYNNRDTGDIVSGGLALTLPTGPGAQTQEGYVHSVLFQPWVGYIRNFERFYVQNFHSLVVPSDRRDVMLLFNDFSAGYWLYRTPENRLVSYIVPTVEAHVTTPMNHIDGAGPLIVPDMVIMTGGLQVGVRRNAAVSFGVCVPVTGPHVLSIEAFAQFNWRF